MVENFTKCQEKFTLKTQEYEDSKMKEYIEKGIFNDNLEIIPKRPKTQQEMELETIEALGMPMLTKIYKLAYSD